MMRTRWGLGGGLGLSAVLALVACAPVAPPVVHLGLGAAVGQAAGSLLLDFGGGYALQSLATLRSLRVVLTRAGQSLASRSVDAAALQAGQGRVSFKGLSVGPVRVQVWGLDAQGQVLGLAEADAAVVAGEGTRVLLRLAVGADASPLALPWRWATYDESASDVTHPLRLVRARGVPAPGAQERMAIRDLAFDRQSGLLWAAYGEGGIQILPTTLEAPLLTWPGRAYSLGALPGGGMMGCDGIAPEYLANGSSQGVIPIRRFVHQNGVLQQHVVEEKSDHQGRGYMLSTTPEGQVVLMRQDRQLVGPGMPDPTGTWPRWQLGTPAFQFPSFNSHLAYGQMPYFKLESGSEAGGVLVNDSHSGARVTDQGVGERLLSCATSNPSQLSSETLIAQNESQINAGPLTAKLRALVPDHRGGHWAVTTTYGIYHQMTVVWRRAPNGQWKRVWGPWLSPAEMQAVQQGGTSGFFPGSHPQANQVQSLGILRQTHEARDLMACHNDFAMATSKPGVLALSNGHGIFLLEERRDESL